MAELKTRFWRHAAQSFPERTRRRYMADLQSVEHVELVLDGIVELLQRARSALHQHGGIHSA